MLGVEPLLGARAHLVLPSTIRDLVTPEGAGIFKTSQLLNVNIFKSEFHQTGMKFDYSTGFYNLIFMMPLPTL